MKFSMCALSGALLSLRSFRRAFLLYGIRISLSRTFLFFFSILLPAPQAFLQATLLYYQIPSPLSTPFSIFFQVVLSGLLVKFLAALRAATRGLLPGQATYPGPCGKGSRLAGLPFGQTLQNDPSGQVLAEFISLIGGKYAANSARCPF